MEIVLAFLFLIGALAISSNASMPTGTEGAEHIEARTEQASYADVAGTLQRPCRYTYGPPLQRDLTVPREAAPRLTGNIIEEPRRACSDK